MAKDDFVARASVDIKAPPQDVWKALTDPELIAQYMFGTKVVAEWRQGGPISWKGEWEGKPYEDKGEVLKLEPPSLLQYSHFSPLSGLPDLPENYHTVTIELTERGDQTRVSLSQDNNPTQEVRNHSQENWQGMLQGLKEVVER